MEPCSCYPSSSSSSCPPEHVKTWEWTCGSMDKKACIYKYLVGRSLQQKRSIYYNIYVGSLYSLNPSSLRSFIWKLPWSRAFNYLITAASSAEWQGILSSDKQGPAHTLKTRCGPYSPVTKQPRADFFVFWLILWARGLPQGPSKLDLMESRAKWNSRVLWLFSQGVYFLTHVPASAVVAGHVWRCSSQPDSEFFQ